jgi:DNA-binding NarL/FixJ family response regulator
MLQRILIIDDAEDMEFLIRFCTYMPTGLMQYLEMYDPRCGIPEKSFNWSRYDLLLLDYDLGLAGENGLDWALQLMEDEHLPPVVMLTGYASEKLSKKALSSGVDGFLDKNTLTPENFAANIKNIYSAISEGQRRPSQMRKDAEKTQYLSPEDKLKILKKASDKTAVTADENDFEKTRLLPVNDNVSESLAASGYPEQSISSENTSATTASRQTTASYPRKSAQSDDIPVTVPGYTISQKIGEGGMASIYLAERDDDHLKVVLKVLNLSNNDDSSLLRRFMREYKLIAQYNTLISSRFMNGLLRVHLPISQWNISAMVTWQYDLKKVWTVVLPLIICIRSLKVWAPPMQEALCTGT